MHISLSLIVALLASLLCSPLAFAKFSPDLSTAIENQYTPAVAHKGLLSAQQPLEAAKLRGFVVLLQGGIPAEKAYWYVTNQDYEYRPMVVDVATGRMKTRRGTVFTYLDRGQVMLIAGVSYVGNTVYLKLLSPEVYRPTAKNERHPSRVATMLGVKFPAAQLKAGDAPSLLATLEQWAKPFPDRATAEAFATQLRAMK
ncbi:MAG: hypothetical protein HY696_11550 [Deltaproteobacteria bacterium]|nr:hypothetical protein [Deltaproteobacteria bacterium]